MRTGRARQGLRLLIEADGEIEIIGEAASYIGREMNRISRQGGEVCPTCSPPSFGKLWQVLACTARAIPSTVSGFKAAPARRKKR